MSDGGIEMKKLILYVLLTLQTIGQASFTNRIKPPQLSTARLSLSESNQLIQAALHCRHYLQPNHLIIQDNGQNPILIEMTPKQLYDQKKLIEQHHEQEQIEYVQQNYQAKLKIAHAENQFLKICSKCLIITTVVSTLYACYVHSLACR